MTTTPTIWKAKFPANVGTFGTQQAPQTIGLTNGNILVVWEDTTGGTSPGSDIMGQMFDAAGNQAGVAFQVNSTVVNVDETEPKIVALPDGGFVVAYGSYNDAIGGFIVVDRINSTGGSASSRFITDNNNNTLTKWEITADAAGNYIVAFERAGNVKAVRYDHATNNAGPEFNAVQNGTDFDHLGGIAVFSNGNVVTISHESDQVTYGVPPFGETQIHDTVEFKIVNPATGVTVVNPVEIKGARDIDARSESVAVLESGAFVIVYKNVSFSQPGSADIALKIVSSGAPGATVGPEIIVAGGSHDLANARVLALPDGGFFVAWADRSIVSIVGRRFDANGAGIGSSFVVAPEIFGDFPLGSLALTSDGRILVTFRNSAGEISEVILDPRENTIHGTAASEVLTTQIGSTIIFGETGNDTILGQNGNDTIDGGLGTDTLKGGAGGDTYILKDVHRADIFSKFVFDAVTESFGAGTDTVRVQRTGSVSSYTLTANVERGIVEGGDEFTLSGNSLGNTLTGNFARNTLNGLDGNDTLIGSGGDDTINGNSGHDTLIGGIGADTLNGGLGDDTYVIGTNDFLNEDQDAGLDTVTIASSYTLLGNFENLVLTGGSAINGTGNALGNRITGNGAVNTLNGDAGNDVLDGKAGADTLRGATGNDTYVVDSISDVVIEAAGEGTDNANASVSYILGANVDAETLRAVDPTATTVFSLVGNGINNIVTGNAGGNGLSGAAGNDTLKGLQGNDALTGGTGGDLFVFSTTLNATTNVDQIMDFSVTDDTIQLENNGVFTALTTIGTLAATAFRIGSVAADADDRIIYNSTAKQLYYDADGNGAGTAIKFATFSMASAPALTNVDFVVI